MVSPRSQATSCPSMVTSTWSGRGLVCADVLDGVAMRPPQLPEPRGHGLLDARAHLDGVELADLAAGVALDAVR